MNNQKLSFSRIQGFIALSMVSTFSSVSLSIVSIWNNLSIVLLQFFVGLHSGIIGLAIFAYLCKILSTDDGQQGFILKKIGLITSNFNLEAYKSKELLDDNKESNLEETSLDDEKTTKNGH